MIETESQPSLVQHVDDPAFPDVVGTGDAVDGGDCKSYVDYRGIEKKVCPSITFQEVLNLVKENNRNDQAKNIVIIDTRTPKEYEESHVIDAISIPLMNNDQRHIIGKTYKQESKQAAITKGWHIFSPLISNYVKQFEQYKNKQTDVYIYCWRGGMRSRIVTNLLNMNGFGSGDDDEGNTVHQVTGGFKVYMNDIVWKGLDSFAVSYPPTFIVLFGNTGSGKTQILKKLEQTKVRRASETENEEPKGHHNVPVLDLEGLAGHMGSLYGNVDKEPKSQKMFSILLYHKLEELQGFKYVFVEGESNKVGNVHLPIFLYEKIQSRKNGSKTIQSSASASAKEGSEAKSAINDSSSSSSKDGTSSSPINEDSSSATKADMPLSSSSVPPSLSSPSLNVLIQASIPTRIKVIREEYDTTKEESIQQIRDATNSISMQRNIGKKNVALLHQLLDEKKFDEFTEWLLVNYYDLRYRFTKQDYHYSLTVTNDHENDMIDCCSKLIDFYYNLHKP